MFSVCPFIYTPCIQKRPHSGILLKITQGKITLCDTGWTKPNSYCF